MISVKELMIGDLVNYRPGWINEETNQVEYESGTGFPVRIEMLYYSHGEGLVQYNDGENDGIEAAEYELFPIPLTAEILEKNGWRPRTSVPGEFYLKKPFVDAAIVTKTVIGFQMNHGPFNGLSIHYVHQLQHALQLCGITKEIII